MVLTVPIEGFAEAVKSHGDLKNAYVTTFGSQTVVTAFDPASGVIVRAHSLEPTDSVRKGLESKGIKVSLGHWGDRSEDPGALWVAAVAYKSVESMPGVWVDTFEDEPSKGQVLQAMYDEFRASGEAEDVLLDEFIELVEPNVVVLSPDRQAEFARTKGC
jgi:hypothetical protein